MDLPAAILGTVEAYATLVQFDAVIEGEERLLLYGAAKTQFPKAGDERLAWEIADFLPIALARPEIAARGVTLHEHYARIDSRGRLRTYRRLLEEPVYREAAAMADELLKSQRDVAAAIKSISVEYQLVDSTLRSGVAPGDLEAAPPVLNGPDELCGPLAQRPVFADEPWWLAAIAKHRRPWWKFW